MESVLAASARLHAGLEQIPSETPGIRAIRNAGLFFGVDIGLESDSTHQRRGRALDVVNLMRDDGVLISTTSANEDTLKIRPPLVCQEEHVDLFLRSLRKVLVEASS